jgi:hypothetical protein
VARHAWLPRTSVMPFRAFALNSALGAIRRGLFAVFDQRDDRGALKPPMAEDRKDLAYINKTLTVPLLYVVT